MTEQKHPVVMCDGDDGMCGAVEFDYTLGGLATLTGSATQLPPGWSGDKPGSRGRDEHYCPDCTSKRTAAYRMPVQPPPPPYQPYA